MDENTTNTGVENTTTETETINKTYTLDEVNQLLQSEVDRRMTSAQKKWEKTAQQKVAEAERLAKMSEDERSQERVKSLQAELEKRERDINIRENKITCLQEMDKRGIPNSLVDFIVTDDADSMLDNLTLFEKTFKKAIDEEVSKRIQGTTPKTGSKDPNEITKADVKKMSLDELNNLYQNNKDLYMSLVK